MAVYDFKAQRLFVEHALAARINIQATREQAHYLLNVLRLREDDKILLFNGQDGEWLASIFPEGRKKCRLICLEQTRKQPSPFKLTYLFAPLKQARLDYMIQKAVEMGVGNLQPVITKYTQISKVNLDRMKANAIEAAEQCGILTIPVISEPAPLSELLDGWSAADPLIFCDEAAEYGEGFDELVSLKGKHITVLIGPEGGFSDEERSILNDLASIYRLSLGPRILRADTAAVAALALVQAHAGDW